MGHALSKGPGSAAGAQAIPGDGRCASAANLLDVLLAFVDGRGDAGVALLYGSGQRAQDVFAACGIAQRVPHGFCADVVEVREVLRVSGLLGCESDAAVLAQLRQLDAASCNLVTAAVARMARPERALGLVLHVAAAAVVAERLSPRALVLALGAAQRVRLFLAAAMHASGGGPPGVLPNADALLCRLSAVLRAWGADAPDGCAGVFGAGVHQDDVSLLGGACGLLHGAGDDGLRALDVEGALLHGAVLVGMALGVRRGTRLHEACVLGWRVLGALDGMDAAPVWREHLLRPAAQCLLSVSLGVLAERGEAVSVPGHCVCGRELSPGHAVADHSAFGGDQPSACMSPGGCSTATGAEAETAHMLHCAEQLAGAFVLSPHAGAVAALVQGAAASPGADGRRAAVEYAASRLQGAAAAAVSRHVAALLSPAGSESVVCAPGDALSEDGRVFDDAEATPSAGGGHSRDAHAAAVQWAALAALRCGDERAPALLVQPLAPGSPERVSVVAAVAERLAAAGSACRRALVAAPWADADAAVVEAQLRHAHALVCTAETCDDASDFPAVTSLLCAWLVARERRHEAAQAAADAFGLRGPAQIMALDLSSAILSSISSGDIKQHSQVPARDEHRMADDRRPEGSGSELDCASGDASAIDALRPSVALPGGAGAADADALRLLGAAARAAALPGGRGRLLPGEAAALLGDGEGAGVLAALVGTALGAERPDVAAGVLAASRGPASPGWRLLVSFLVQRALGPAEHSAPIWADRVGASLLLDAAALDAALGYASALCAALLLDVLRRSERVLGADERAELLQLAVREALCCADCGWLLPRLASLDADAVLEALAVACCGEARRRHSDAPGAPPAQRVLRILRPVPALLAAHRAALRPRTLALVDAAVRESSALSCP